jgi:hypothetical protein
MAVYRFLRKSDSNEPFSYLGTSSPNTLPVSTLQDSGNQWHYRAIDQVERVLKRLMSWAFIIPVVSGFVECED